MSDFAALGVMVALIIANAFLFVLMDQWVQTRSDAIISGVIRGVPVSVKYRRYLLSTRFVINGGTLIGITGVLAVAWALVGSKTTTEELRLLAYLVAFVNAAGAIGWPVTIPFWYLQLAEALRQAEAD